MKTPAETAAPHRCFWAEDDPLMRAYHDAEWGAPERESRAQALLEFDDAVTEKIAQLKEKGFQSPYLRAFVVARINPLRWIKDEPPPLPEVLKTMKERLAKFNVDKVNQQDLARSGGVPDEPS